MNSPTFATDQNGRTINALAPASGQDVALKTSGDVALAAVSDTYRTIRLLAGNADCLIGIGATASYPMKLAQGVPEYVKLEPKMNLYAKGSGTLNVVEMS